MLLVPPLTGGRTHGRGDGRHDVEADAQQERLDRQLTHRTPAVSSPVVVREGGCGRFIFLLSRKSDSLGRFSTAFNPNVRCPNCQTGGSESNCAERANDK